MVNDIVQRIEPYIKSAAKLSDQVNALTNIPTTLMDVIVRLPDDKRLLFTVFSNAYLDFLEKNQANNQMLTDFQTALTSQATKLVGEYAKLHRTSNFTIR